MPQRRGIKMRTLIAWLGAFLVFLSVPASAAFWIAQTYGPATATGNILPMGAGGYITGFSISSNDAMVIRTDTYGAYVWNGSALSPVGTTGTWQQTVNANSMPGSFVSNFQALANTGVYEIQVAWKNSNILYMVYNVYISGQNPPYQTVYKSTNGGVTWAATTFTPLNFQSYLGSDFATATIPLKAWGPKLSIDPTDSNAQTAYVGTGANGLWVTTNGGASWSQVSTSSVPVALTDPSSNYPGYVVVMSGFTAGDVYAFSYGNGVYLNHSGSWSNISSGGPTIVQHADIDPNTGTYYAIDGAGNAWSYVIGTGWTKVYNGTSDNALTIAVDHNNANHIVIGDVNGNLNESTNAGSSFGGWSTACTNCSSTGDVIWLSLFAANAKTLAFDSVTAKKVWGATDRGVATVTYTGSITGATNLVWGFQARGIEQLVSNNVLLNASATPYVAVWDSGTFGPLNLSAYPAAPAYPDSISVVATWSLDQCTGNTANLVANADGGYAGGGDYESYYNGSWSNFASNPPTISGGSIACNDLNHILFAPQEAVPAYTTNGGANWTNISISGISDWTGFQPNYTYGGRGVAADRGGGSTTYYLFYNTKGFYTSTNNGSTWSSLATYVSNTSKYAQIKTPIGQTGDWWFSGGQNQGADQTMPCGTALLHYYSGSVTTITNVSCPYTVGFGYNGGGYPAVFIVAWVSGVFGLYESDNASTGATPTWTLKTTYPCNSLDEVQDISGDPSIHGRWYVAFGGSGGCYGSFLLNRDIDPTNDNSPMGLNKVA